MRVYVSLDSILVIPLTYPPKLTQHVMLLLLYANEMVLFTYDVIAMQSLLGVD